MVLGTNHKESAPQPSKEARGWSTPDTAGKGKRLQAVFITSLCAQKPSGKLQIPLVSPGTHSNPTGFPRVLGTLCCAAHHGGHKTSPRETPSKGRRRALGLWTRLIPPAGSCSGHQARTSQKKTSNLPSPRRYRRLAHCPFVNACWVRVKIRRLLHYDASSCMKVYFKESLEAVRGLGRTGMTPAEGGLTEGCCTQKSPGYRIKLCFTCKGKLIKVSLWFQSKLQPQNSRETVFISLIAFHLVPAP